MSWPSLAFVVGVNVERIFASAGALFVAVALHNILGLAVDPSQKELLDDEKTFTLFRMDIQDLGHVYRDKSNSVAWRLLDNIFESNSFPDKIRDSAGVELGYTWAQRYVQIHPWKSEALIALAAALVAAGFVEVGIEMYRHFSNSH